MEGGSAGRRFESGPSATSPALPDFTIDHEVDPVRQAIADSWPEHVDDSAARDEWGRMPEYDLPRMTAETIEKLGARRHPAG